MSSLFTGLYLHNHQTVNNSINGGCSCLYWQNTHEKRSFVVPPKAVGYKTFYAGKYLNQEKHWLLRMSPVPLPHSIAPCLDNIYSRRWETLLSVDDMVETLIERLNTLGLLNKTFVIFTSDHGFHVGQFSLPWDKRQPYDFDIKIPLLICGPGIKSKMTINYPVLNIDVAPTILTMADLEPPAYMDGNSYLPMLLKKAQTNVTGRAFLVEYIGEGQDSTLDPSCVLPHDNSLSECVADTLCKCQDSRNNTFSCLRYISLGNNFIFCVFKDDENFIESYNLLTDPFQLHNLAMDLNNTKIESYMSAIYSLQKCSGKFCNKYVII